MDKNSKSVTSLFIVLALLALVALALSVSRQNQDGAGAELLPGLTDSLAQLTAVRISGAGNTLIADIRNSDNGWVMANADNYPADVNELRSLLTGLGDAQIIEQTTAVAENYSRIGVTDISAAEAEGVLVELVGTAEPVAVLIGNAGSGSTTFVRKADSAQSYRVSGSLKPARETSAWLDRVVVNLPATDVLALRIEHADGETLTIEKSGTGYILAEQPADLALTSPTVLNNIAGALADVRFEEVMSVESLADAAESNTSPVASISVNTVDGLTLQINASQIGDSIWLSLTPAYDAGMVTASADDDADAGDATPDNTTEARVASIRDRVSGWAYRIPAYKSDWLLKRADDLLQAAD